MHDFEVVDDCVSFGRKVALFTFLIGSAILAAYYFYNESSFIFFSLFFMVAATFINVYTVIKLLFCWKSNKQNQNKILYTLLLLLLNTPIAYFYVKIGLEIYSNSFPIY